MMSAAVAGTTFRPTRSYTTLRDVTHGHIDILRAELANRLRRRHEREE
jgi:hypothetical protein